MKMKWLFEKKCVDCPYKCVEVCDFPQIIGCTRIYTAIENKKERHVKMKVNIVYFDKRMRAVVIRENYPYDRLELGRVE